MRFCLKPEDFKWQPVGGGEWTDLPLASRIGQRESRKEREQRHPLTNPWETHGNLDALPPEGYFAGDETCEVYLVGACGFVAGSVCV